MRVAVRVDASEHIGTGHLRRCMSLAAALSIRGAEVCFVLRQHDDVAARVLAGSDDRVVWLKAASSQLAPSAEGSLHAAWAGATWDQDAAETVEALRASLPEWLVVDHYGLDARWHNVVRSGLGCRLMAVDDLGDRPLATDVLLDANAALDHREKYAGMLTHRSRMLTGPRFALLSDAYHDAPRYAFGNTVESIGVFMGGTDPGGISASVLCELRENAEFEGPVEVVSTSTSLHLPELREACFADGQAKLSLDLPDLSHFYARHGLHVGAGGTSSYERCCIGVPTIALVVAENQLAVVPILAKLGALHAATLPGFPETEILVGAQRLGNVVRDLIGNPDVRRSLAEVAQTLVDARGAERAALVLLAETLTLRAATMDDGAMLHAWRNDPATRAVSLDSAEISFSSHLAWLEEVLANPARRLLIAVVGGQPIGSIRFDQLENASLEVSLYLDPGLHGLGLGQRMLLAGEEAIAAGASTEFVATVLEGNAASARLFASCGYSGGPLRYSKTVNPKKAPL